MTGIYSGPKYHEVCMTALLHCGHKTALDFSYSGGRFVPTAAVTANRLLAPWGTYDNQIAWGKTKI